MEYKILIFIINAFWLVLPAYAANFFPVIVRGKSPMDFRKKFFDKKRILGEGKTWEGFFYGILFGFFVGFLQILFQPSLSYLLIYRHSFFTIFILSFGALIGDCIGSFVKRRFDLRRGEPAPLLDQLDFLIFSLFLLKFFINFDFHTTLFLIAVTPLIHFISNLFGFFLRLKKEPW